MCRDLRVSEGRAALSYLRSPQSIPCTRDSGGRAVGGWGGSGGKDGQRHSSGRQPSKCDLGSQRAQRQWEWDPTGKFWEMVPSTCLR